MLKAKGPEATMVCQDDQTCLRIKVVIEGAVHEVQFSWDESLTTEDWGFLIVDANNAFKDINRVGML